MLLEITVLIPSVRVSHTHRVSCVLFSCCPLSVAVGKYRPDVLYLFCDFFFVFSVLRERKDTSNHV